MHCEGCREVLSREGRNGWINMSPPTSPPPRNNHHHYHHHQLSQPKLWGTERLLHWNKNLLAKCNVLIVLCNPFNILFLFQCRTDLYVWCILLQSRKYIVLQQMQLQSKWSGAILFISTTSLSQWISFIRPICYFHSGCILLCPDIRSIIHFTGFRFVPTSWASLPPEHRVLCFGSTREIVASSYTAD